MQSLPRNAHPISAKKELAKHSQATYRGIARWPRLGSLSAGLAFASAACLPPVVWVPTATLLVSLGAVLVMGIPVVIVQTEEERLLFPLIFEK